MQIKAAIPWDAKRAACGVLEHLSTDDVVVRVRRCDEKQTVIL